MHNLNNSTYQNPSKRNFSVYNAKSNVSDYSLGKNGKRNSKFDTSNAEIKIFHVRPHLRLPRRNEFLVRDSLNYLKGFAWKTFDYSFGKFILKINIGKTICLPNESKKKRRRKDSVSQGNKSTDSIDGQHDLFKMIFRIVKYSGRTFQQQIFALSKSIRLVWVRFCFLWNRRSSK